MLLLYQPNLFGQWRIYCYLHSTMLLLYRRQRRDLRWKKSWIYIPLCFYFIGFFYKFNEKAILIYIPLCFYFIYLVFYHCVIFFRIYIPLCFYFIYLVFYHCVIFFRIYIPLCFYFIVTVQDNDTFRSYDLHSTMLLLYHFSRTRIQTARCNLHSTMLLLYPISQI